MLCNVVLVTVMIDGGSMKIITIVKMVCKLVAGLIIGMCWVLTAHAWPGLNTPNLLSPVTRVEAIATLRFFLTQVPMGLYPHLQFITVGDFQLLQAQALMCPVIEGYGQIGCGINTFPESALNQMEAPFPSDAPDANVQVDLFYGATGHELGHQISQYLGHRWHSEPGPSVGSSDYPVDRGYSEWQRELINEAGCEPQHYLRSMLPSCFFQNAPQEFLASIANQWFACSECVLRLAMKRWKDGNPHPLNQAVLAMVAWSSKAGTTWLPTPMHRGVIHAYRYLGLGRAQQEIWQTTAWRCGAESTVIGPSFMLTLSLDSQCRVIDAEMG